MELENGAWRFNKKKQRKETKKGVKIVSPFIARNMVYMLRANLNPDDDRPAIPLGLGDPSSSSGLRPPPVAVDAIVDNLCSAQFNGYATALGLLPSRKAVAEYISSDLSYDVSPDDVYLTLGCKQAIQATLSALAHPDANILLPCPTSFALYEATAAVSGLEVRHFDLLPDKQWEVDLESIEALADDNTMAIVIINPGNPCGSVYTQQHLEKIAETARKLGILVIADEVYAHLTYGSNPFIRMGVFASIAPVLTLGSISKRWVAPGWRLGWLIVTDPNGIIEKKSGLLEEIKAFLGVTAEPPTFIQAALPQIIEKTKEEFFSKVVDVLRQGADIIFEKLKEIPCLTCPYKPEGSMFIMVKLNLSLLDGIHDDVDFCLNLVKEEKVIVLPGSTIGITNWIRITFAVEASVLEDGVERIKAFCQRNAKGTIRSLHS